MNSVYPVILSGGSGTRLWPLSREAFPKQFLDLFGGRSLFQKTCLRLADPLFGPPAILTNQDHRFLVAEQMRELEISPEAIVLEPVGRNTAPAALIAALMAYRKDENNLLLLLPSDHVVSDDKNFVSTIAKGIEAAQAGHFVTFGVKPDKPETGYGYIEVLEGGTEVLDVARFVEKPSREKAESYMESGMFYWNAGIFLASARSVIEAFETHAPAILEHVRPALDKATSDLDFLRLDKDAYEQCENISLDYAIMEKTSDIKCVPLETGWNDLGTWPSLWDIVDKDKSGNVVTGDVIVHDTTNSYVHSTDGACLSLIGLDNVIAVATKDAVLVTPKQRAQDVKHIVESLKASGRDEVVIHKRVYRPWGWYEGLSMGERYQVKCLMVKPGAQLSLQSHHHRAEHWVVVSGTAEVTLDDKKFLLSENESTYIPIGTVHRLGNRGKVPALLIEVQSGSYLKEDDIVRYEDDFGREKDT